MNRKRDKRKWNQNKNRSKTEYEEEWRGTKMEDGSKLDEWKSHEPRIWGWLNEEGKYYCPCTNCLNGRWQLLDDIREHLLCDGIKKNYTMWIWHGEVIDMQSGSQSEPLGGHDSWPWTRVFSASTRPCVWRIAEWFKEAFVYGVQEFLNPVVCGVKSG